MENGLTYKVLDVREFFDRIVLILKDTLLDKKNPATRVRVEITEDKVIEPKMYENVQKLIVGDFVRIDTKYCVGYGMKYRIDVF